MVFDVVLLKLCWVGQFFKFGLSERLDFCLCVFDNGEFFWFLNGVLWLFSGGLWMFCMFGGY